MKLWIFFLFLSSTLCAQGLENTRIKRGIYAGSFDPPTIAHVDIIQRASLICDELIVCVAVNPLKTYLIPSSDRVKLLTETLHPLPNVKVVAFNGLLTDFAKENEANFLVRGLRSAKDFDAEYPMSIANYELSGIETLFFMSKPEFMHISSSLVREIHRFHGSIENLVPIEAKKYLEHKK